MTMAKTKIMIKLANGKYIDMSKAIKPEDKVHKVMREFKEGKLKSSSGQVVTSRDQAVAIAMSESGLSKNMVADIAIEYDSMEKARPTKYIKRVPKPSGKGYYYFYTKQQLKDFHEKGIKPEEKKESGSFWDKVKSFFGQNADEKVNKLHDMVSKQGISVSKDSLAEHLAEYLSNKEKWDSKFRGEKKEKSEAKPKAESAKSEKKESSAEKKEGGKWNTNLMKFFSNQYGVIGALAKEEVKKQSQDSESKSESKDNFDTMPEEKVSSQDIIFTIKNLTGSQKTGNLDWTFDEDSKKIKAYHSITGSEWGEINVETNEIISKKGEKKDLEKIYNEIKEKTIERKDKMNLDNLINYPIRNKESILKILERNKDKKWIQEYKNIIPSATEALKEELAKKEGGGKTGGINNIKILDEMFHSKSIEDDTAIEGILKTMKRDGFSFNDISKYIKDSQLYDIIERKSKNQKPSPTSDAMPKEIERTERFPEVPTYAEPPEGFKKVEGTTAPKGYEFYRNGSPLSKDYKKILVKDKSKVEALKDELGKKKGESKEREITVFGKQQKVKTKPIELNLGYEHPFEIAKRDFGNNRSDWVILESSTGLRVGAGKTRKDAIENAETMIKKYTKSESEFKQLVENNMSKNIENKDKIEQEARKQVEKDFEDKSSKGQASIKKMEEEDKKQKKQKENLQSKDPQVKYDAMKEEIRDFAERNNISEKEISKEWIDEERKRFQQDIKDAYKYKKPKEAGVYKVRLKELDNIEKYQKEIISLKEELLGPKMFKALSNLRQEIMLKAQPTKYIKRIPNPKGKGYIYFYTQQQVKDYEKSGKLPDDQQKKPEVKQSTDKGNIEILKESIKKVASIFADALSAKDAVQPSGSAVEQTGENIAQKSKDKKRLEKQRDISKTTKKNTPEEKPTK